MSKYDEQVKRWEAILGNAAAGTQEFYLGLAELEATDENSPEFQLIDDYAVWLVNNR